MTKKIILIAPVLTQSGYGVHSRQVVKYLFNLIDQGADISLDISPINCGNTQYYLNKSDPFIRRIYEHTARKNFEYDVSIQVQMPSPREWNPGLAPINIGITAGIETDLCHPQWLQTVNAMSLVIVPSTFAKNAFVNASSVYNMPLTTPVEVVKEFVSEVFYEKSEEEDIFKDLKTDFNFLVFGQITGLDKDTDRKNLFLTLQTLFAAFHNDPSVGIIVKTNLGRETGLDNLHVKNVLGQIKEATCDFTGGQGIQPKIYCLHGAMSESELRRVYQSPKVKALYTTTRGEAVGLPMVEAAASCLPIIATDKGGHTEYLEPQKWLGLKSTLQTISEKKADPDIFPKDSKWFEVDPQEAIKTLQRFHKNSSKPKEWAISQSKNIKKQISVSEIFSKYDSVLKQYLV